MWNDQLLPRIVILAMAGMVGATVVGTYWEKTNTSARRKRTVTVVAVAVIATGAILLMFKVHWYPPADEFV